VIIHPGTPNLSQEVERFLSQSEIELENIPVTIIVNPPIKTVIENVDTLSEILTELLAAYGTEGNYFLVLSTYSEGITVAFGIKHTATAFTTEAGHC
jgi:hypothetical protein